MRQLIATYVLLMGLSSCSNPAAERPDARIVERYPIAVTELTRIDGITVDAGGYSGLAIDANGELWVNTDRGPNLEAAAFVGAPAKRFPLPNYQPAVFNLNAARFIDALPYNPQSRRTLDYRALGSLHNGLPPKSSDSKAVVEVALGPDFERINYQHGGIDTEGIAFGGGRVWLCEEYAPSILSIDDAGTLTRYTPTPTERYDKPLPSWLLQRRPNLGFEGLAFTNEHLYAALQGPLSPPGGDAFTPLVRILRLDPQTDQVRAFVYALDGTQRKIGDMAVAPDGRLLVLEHGILFGGKWSAEIYAIDLQRIDFLNVDGLHPERFRSPATAVTSGVLIAPKTLYIDLLAAGYPPRLDKPEGLAVDAAGKVFLINDNDYGIDSPLGTGSAVATGIGTELMVIE